MALFVEESLDSYSQAEPYNEDVLETLLRNKENLPPTRFDCGRADELIEYNRILHRQLLEHHIPHHYEEFDGGHEWPYWTEHLKDSLLFFGHLLTN